MFEVNKKDTKTTSKTNVFIVNFEHYSNFVQVFRLLTFKMYLFAGCSFYQAQIKSSKNKILQNKMLDTIQDGSLH